MILEDHGVIEESDRIFVSNEHRRSKASGHVKFLSEQTGVPPAKIIHCGNDIRS